MVPGALDDLQAGAFDAVDEGARGKLHRLVISVADNHQRGNADQLGCVTVRVGTLWLRSVPAPRQALAEHCLVALAAEPHLPGDGDGLVRIVCGPPARRSLGALGGYLDATEAGTDQRDREDAIGCLYRRPASDGGADGVADQVCFVDRCGVHHSQQVGERVPGAVRTGRPSHAVGVVANDSVMAGQRRPNVVPGARVCDPGMKQDDRRAGARRFEVEVGASAGQSRALSR